MKKTVFLSLISVLVLFNFISGSQKQQKALPQEKHEVEVRLVLVDVLVTKDGEFITDLTKDDFELYEDGKRVPINSFELISFEERESAVLKEKLEEKATPAVPKKQLVVLLDGVCSWQRHIKEGARKIVDQLLSLVRLGNEVMITQISEKKGLEVIQPFTANEELIRKALVKASGSLWVDKSLDALKMWEEAGLEVDEELGAAEKYEERLQPVLEDEYLFLQRGRFEKVMGGIFTVASMIKDLPGRKSVLLISDGLPDLSSTTLNSRITEATGEGSSGARTTRLDIRRDVGTIRIFDPFNILEKKKIMSGEEIIRELIRFANAQNISIYSLDPDAFTKYLIPTSAEFGPRERMIALSFQGEEKIKRVQNLTWLSEDTGAVTLKGAKKYDRFFEVMNTDLNYYYELSFYPQRKEADNIFHKLKVKVNRPGVEVRFRKGYTDYSRSEREKIHLISAFYNPTSFKQLPFEAEFVLFYKDSQVYEPWMNIALPGKELFLKRGVENQHGLKTFNLHVWIKDTKRGEKAFGGQINIPLNVDASFIDIIKTTDYLCFHYKGPGIKFGQKEYQAIFALYDSQREEIGTWESTFSLPDDKTGDQSAIINCVLGLIASNPKKGGNSFSLSKEDGSLVFGQTKFFPSITNRFQRMQDASVFLQIFLPQGKLEVQPRFKVSGEGRLTQRVPAEIVAETWNKKTKIWSGIFNLQLRTVIFGEYTLKVEIPVSEEGDVLSTETRLIKLRY
jgi:VWFA-related protein